LSTEEEMLRRTRQGIDGLLAQLLRYYRRRGEKGVERSERYERGERYERNGVERNERYERNERNERYERNERSERYERGERNERNSGYERYDNNERNERSNQDDAMHKHHDEPNGLNHTLTDCENGTNHHPNPTISPRGYPSFINPSLPLFTETTPILPDETPHSFWTWIRSLFSQPIKSAAGSFAIGGLPRSLRHLPLLLFALRRGSLLGDGFRGEELIQLRRLRLAAASLQDSLRILLPRVIVALQRNAPPLTRINSMPLCAPPRDETVGERRFGDETVGLTYTASMPQIATYAMTQTMTQTMSPRKEETVGEENGEIVEETESFSDSESETNESGFKVTGFLPEDGGEMPFYLESRLVTHLATRPLPEFHMVPAETLALLSNAVVVVDTLREIFIWVGAQHGSIENDPVYGGGVSLALSLAQHRSPPSAIRVVFENSSSARFVLCCLIPSHKDPLEVAAKTISPLQTLSPQALRDHVSKFFYTDDMSFREYMTKLYHFGWVVCWESE